MLLHQVMLRRRAMLLHQASMVRTGNRSTDSLSTVPLAHMDNPMAALLHHNNRAAIMAGSSNHRMVDSSSITTKAVTKVATKAAVILDSTVE